MERVVRIEIVTLAVEVPRVLRLLRGAGITAYTIIDGVRGAGDRGRQDADDVTGICANGVVMTACAPDKLQEVLEPIRAVLREVGGECFVSEASRVRH